MKNRQIIIPFLFAALLIALLWTTLQGAQTAAQADTTEQNEKQQQTAITNLVTSSESLSFVLNVPTVQKTSGDGVEIPGLNSRINQPGAPALPYYATFIALPPGASAVLTVEPLNASILPDWTISAVPDPQSTVGFLEEATDFAAVHNERLESPPDPAIYGKDANYPGQLYEVSEPMYVRDKRLINLEIYPLQYNPVSGELTHYEQLQLTIDFVGGTDDVRPLNGRSPFAESLDNLILNAEQAKNWSSLPDEMRDGGTALPIGSDAYKIEVNQDGIYEVSYADLQAAGMNVGAVNPNTFQMLYRGQSVAYEFVGDGDNQFESGEKVRFYGWAFNGSRLEKQFINDNVFWLWANGSPTTIGATASQNGLPIATTFQSSITVEPETIWYPTWTDEWDMFPNEPDAWYWIRMGKPSAAPVTTTVPFNLPYPASSGPNADITAEFSSKLSPIVSNVTISHEMVLKANGHPNIGYLAWIDKQNVNVTTDIPMSAVISGSNSFDLGMHTAASVSSGSQAVYLNRITVDYTRLFTATADQLIFSDEVGGSRGFQIDGYSQNNPNNVLVWDITNPEQPTEVTGVSVTGGGPNYTYEFGTNHPAGATFIATTNTNILSPNQISRYDVPDLEPSGNGADWVAVAYKDFITETQVLADHREDPLYGSYNSHVVDIEDVINQYAYGLPIPAAVSDYLAHGLATWQIPPAYLLLVGDATIDPHQVTWSAPQYVMTDLAFVDRFQGQIPSDYTFSLLVGNDILPDLAVGRITAKTAADVTAVVDKIIIYDQNQLFPSSWMDNFVFLSDNTDAGGNFCLENQEVSDHIPNIFDKTQLCLPDNPTTTDADNLRTALFNHINVTGTLLLNYRGHGSINTWASGPTLLDQTYVNSWNNPVKPVVTLTGDCLDGFFAFPTLEGLGETFLRADDKGTAAHWSSSGLGLSFEHSILVERMYDAFFLEGVTTLGDASNFAKVKFNLIGGHQSLLYSFILEGDPAMQLMRPDLTIDKTSIDTIGSPGETAEFTLDIANLGIYPSHVTVTDTLPAGLDYVSFQSSLSTTATLIGNDVVFNLQFGNDILNAGLTRNETAVITLTTVVANDAISGTVTNSAAIGGFGLDTVPANNDDSSLYTIFVEPVMDFINYIPIVLKS